MNPSLANRMFRAVKLDPLVYEEVEGDPAATRQAALVVLLSSAAAGFAVIRPGTEALWVMLSNVLASLAGWFLWAVMIFLLGTRLFRRPETRTNVGELLRTLGFASAPGIIRLAAVVPGFGPPVFFIASIWMITATVIAVRQALDLTGTGRALLICLTGWFFQALLIWILLLSAGSGPAAVPVT